MSIIHDALKRVQQELAPKTDQTAPGTKEGAQMPSEPLFATPPAVEPSQKRPAKNKIQLLLASTCAILVMVALTIASIDYIFQQLQNDIPKVQKLAKKSLYTLIHKKELPKPSEELKPLAQLIITPTTGAHYIFTPSAHPLTLNIHGIMSNASGNLALINDQVYQEGDVIDGAKIVKINLDSITVNINGTEKTVFVKS